MTDSTVRPFSINIAEDDLGRRLAATRWPEAETGDGWNQGLPLAYARELCAYWQLEYRWRDREQYLNTFPQFQTQLQGLDIHFIHVKSAEANARPLIVTHGWPGSVVEFHKVIGLLVDPVAHGGVAEVAMRPLRCVSPMSRGPCRRQRRCKAPSYDAGLADSRVMDTAAASQNRFNNQDFQ